jgi:hypothetical protein
MVISTKQDPRFHADASEARYRSQKHIMLQSRPLTTGATMRRNPGYTGGSCVRWRISVLR